MPNGAYILIIRSSKSISSISILYNMIYDIVDLKQYTKAFAIAGDNCFYLIYIQL